MSIKPEFLAAELEAVCFGPSMVQNELALRVKAAAELRRLAAVEAERDALVAAIGNHQLAAFIEKHGDPVPIVAERDQLRAEVEALRADAERYRWLRDAHPADPESIWVARGLPKTGLSWWRHEALDAAVDAARKG